MFKYIILLLLILFMSPVFASTYSTTNGYSPYYSPNYKATNSTYNNYYRRPVNRYINNNYYPPEYKHYRQNAIPSGGLNALEKYALKKSYSSENEIKRLERLESLAFGAVQSGDLDSRYANVENAILARPQNNFKHSLLSNLANYFNGQATGYTPSIVTPGLTSGFTPNYTPFGTSSYIPSPNYNTQRIDQYSNGIFGNGYRIIDKSYGNGSSIKILD